MSVEASTKGDASMFKPGDRVRHKDGREGVVDVEPQPVAGSIFVLFGGNPISRLTDAALLTLIPADRISSMSGAAAAGPVLVEPEPSKPRFPVGTRVRHARPAPGHNFGAGVVARVDPDQPDICYVAFDSGKEVPFYCNCLEAIPDEPEPPHLRGIAAGAHAWQQADARNRHVLIHCRGHVVSVTANTTPTGEAFTVKFLAPMREEAVPAALDAVCANGSRAPVEFGVSHLFAGAV
jgi:hypothetical protein